MSDKFLTFKIYRDEKVGVYYTECDQLCGIVAEAETLEQLKEELDISVSEYYEDIQAKKEPAVLESLTIQYKVGQLSPAYT